VLGTYVTTIGLIGSGHIGSTVARLVIEAGHVARRESVQQPPPA
jgi:predicted dinucleotide-binding enzyme